MLDQAWGHGMRFTLVVNNHGQASTRNDREWTYNPYNALSGGPIPDDKPEQLFHNALAAKMQHRARRYLVARYGDHPAVLQWKLWSEVNLTDGGRAGRRSTSMREIMQQWHREAADDFRALDPVQRPVSTHWSGNYRTPQWSIAGLPELTMICIDAYHGKGSLISQLMWDSTQHKKRGLRLLKKPILVTEYGGSHRAAPPKQMAAEHASAPWSALVAGHASAPLLWWFQWIDQHEEWAPYQAISAFIAGEDLRGGKGTALTIR